MIYLPIDCGKINLDGFIDTGPLSSVITEGDLRKNRLLAPNINLNEDPLSEFQIMVANGQLEAPIATAELQIDVDDITFREKFIVMTNLTFPLIGLLFPQRNSTKPQLRQRIQNSTFFLTHLRN